jgi:hypothetical protein
MFPPRSRARLRGLRITVSWQIAKAGQTRCRSRVPPAQDKASVKRGWPLALT